MGQSVRELKAALAARGVDFSRCCERSELQQLLRESESPASEPPEGKRARTSQTEAEGAPPSLAVADGLQGLSVRELKAALAERDVDVSCCREKSELQGLLREALLRERVHAQPAGRAAGSAARGARPLPGGYLAVRRWDGRRCWAELAAAGHALCFWDDGTETVAAASELEPLPQAALPGPRAFSGSFEAARAEAFASDRLLVAAVLGGEAGPQASRAEGLQALVLASEGVAPLIEANAVFWQGPTAALRPPHLLQLAPDGAPCLAMVLPLAVDAMRVLLRSTGTSKEAVVAAFVRALEALEEHRQQAQARACSEAAQLRREQDEEFAASLAADRLAEAARSTGAEVAGEPTAPCSQPSEQPEALGSVAKARRLLAEEFLKEGPPQPTGAGRARLVLRLPTGERLERTFGLQDPLSRVRRWAECCSLLPEASGRSLCVPERFELATAFPRRKFGPEEDGKSLAELGLAPSAALLLIDVDA